MLIMYTSLPSVMLTGFSWPTVAMPEWIAEMVRGLDAEALVSLREKARVHLDERLRERTDVALIDGEYRLTGSFYEKQLRLVLRNCSIIDPKNVEDYVVLGGYAALSRVLTEMTPDEVVGEMTRSNLRGRGGAGFPTGKKWAEALRHDVPQKYIVCNADEGDPGAFMDRSVLENDPHAVLEGISLDRKSVV